MRHKKKSIEAFGGKIYKEEDYKKLVSRQRKMQYRALVRDVNELKFTPHSELSRFGSSYSPKGHLGRNLNIRI